MDAWFQSHLVANIPAARAFAIKLTRGDRQAAEDLLQDTLVAAMDGWMGFTKGTHMHSWLFTIMRHIHYKQIVRNTRKTATSLDDPDFPEASIPRVEPDLSALLIEDAARMLSILPEEQRAAVQLTCVFNLSVAEAAKRLGVEPGTIKSRVARARDRMLKAVEANELPPRADLTKAIRVMKDDLQALQYPQRSKAERRQRKPPGGSFTP